MHDAPYRLIPLWQRGNKIIGWAKVDPEDYERLNQSRWHPHGKGHPCTGEYLNGEMRTVYMHRLLMGLGRGNPMTVDHINRDPHDNRKANLRIIPHGGQSQNRSGWENVTSKYRGVHWRPDSRKWQAKAGGKKLGVYNSEEEAAAVAAEWRLKNMPYAVD
jgi:hypothetical protein